MTTVAAPGTQRHIPLRVLRWFQPESARSYATATSLLLVVPLLAVLAIGFIYPIVQLVMLSAPGGSLENYARAVQTPLYLDVLLSTVLVAFMVAVATLVLGYPVAYAMAHVKRGAAIIVAACVLIPLWTSILIRSYAWIVLLQRRGIVNTLLIGSGLTEQPLELLYTIGAVTLAMTHVLMPFTILPIYASLRSIPPHYLQAARNLGAGPVRAFLNVTLPLSLPGVSAGCVLSFVLALGFYITPALVGGPQSMLIATLIGQQTTVLLDWPFAAALSTILLVLTLILVFLFRKTLSFSRGLNGVH